MRYVTAAASQQQRGGGAEKECWGGGVVGGLVWMGGGGGTVVWRVFKQGSSKMYIVLQKHMYRKNMYILICLKVPMCVV